MLCSLIDDLPVRGEFQPHIFVDDLGTSALRIWNMRRCFMLSMLCRCLQPQRRSLHSQDVHFMLSTTTANAGEST